MRKSKKASSASYWPFYFYFFLGRDGGIRTRDPLHPMQVRYQAALHPDVSLRL
jgi:hypothetical protein